jgi:hypothetical protein
MEYMVNTSQPYTVTTTPQNFNCAWARARAQRGQAEHENGASSAAALRSRARHPAPRPPPLDPRAPADNLFPAGLFTQVNPTQIVNVGYFRNITRKSDNLCPSGVSYNQITYFGGTLAGAWDRDGDRARRWRVMRVRFAPPAGRTALTTARLTSPRRPAPPLPPPRRRLHELWHHGGARPHAPRVPHAALRAELDHDAGPAFPELP